MFGPLEFPALSIRSSPERETREGKSKNSVTCVLCSNEFLFPDDKDGCFKHIFEAHRLIIADIDKIPNLPKYFKFWEHKFLEGPITEYCTTIHADVKKDGVPQNEKEYYLLSDVHEDDKKIREQLQSSILNDALAQQKEEREDTNYSHGCLFCRLVVEPTRTDYLEHLFTQHNLQLGNPDNLVYVDDLIDLLEKKLERLQCIYCEKYFRDRHILKEHMRKKLHKRINPDNQDYDRFYIVNYKGSNKNWKNERKRRDSAEDEPCDWSDWQEKLTVSIVCLFCETICSSWEEVVTHMKEKHLFDYEQISIDLNFYEQVKLVNFIRKQIYSNKCINCTFGSSSRDELLEHLVSENHYEFPPKKLWNQPVYFFPTYENDAFLCQIDDTIHNEEELNSDLSDALTEIDVLTHQDGEGGVDGLGDLIPRPL